MKKLLLGWLLLAATGYAQRLAVYHDMADAFTVGTDRQKFILIFFYDSSLGRRANVDRMEAAVERVAGEEAIQARTVLGLVDLAHDQAGQAIVRNLNANCPGAACTSGPIVSPTLSMFLPDAKRISEIARLVGVQADFPIRLTLLQRMCEASQPDADFAATCRGAADSQASAAHPGWAHVVSHDGGFVMDLPGIPVETSRLEDTPLGQLQFHFVQCREGAETVGALYFPTVTNIDWNSALQAFTDDLAKLGRMTSVTDVEFQGYRGRRFVVETPEGSRIEGLCFITPRVTYQLFYRSGNDYLAQMAANEFFDSFRLN